MACPIKGHAILSTIIYLFRSLSWTDCRGLSEDVCPSSARQSGTRELFLHFQRIAYEVEHADGHHGYGSTLSDGITGNSHEQGEYRSAEEAHNHQARNLVLLVGHRGERLGKDDGEYVGVAKPDECDACVDDIVGIGNEQSNHGYQHACHTDAQEPAAREVLEDKGAQQASGRTEDEVKARGKSGLVECEPDAFHQEFGSRGVGTYVDTHVAHDAQETQEDEGLSKQAQAIGEARRTVGFLFLNGGRREPEDGNDGHHHVDGEKHAPLKSKGGHGLRSAPHGDVGSQERGYGLDELAEGERAGQTVARDDVAQQRVE